MKKSKKSSSTAKRAATLAKAIKVKSFTVNRRTWYRGKGEKTSRLLRMDGKKCCLGFFALACGYKASEIRRKCSPDAPAEKRNLFPSWMVISTPFDYYRDTDECFRLMSDNDDKVLSDTERERRIKAKFKKHGVTVRFK